MGGQEFTLPGDLPARYVARFMRVSGKVAGDNENMAENADAMDEMTDLVSKLVARYNPSIQHEEIADLLTLQSMTKIVGLAAGSPGDTLEDAVVETLTAGAQPEAAEVALEDPTVSQPSEPAAA